MIRPTPRLVDDSRDYGSVVVCNSFWVIGLSGPDVKENEWMEALESLGQSSHRALVALRTDL